MISAAKVFHWLPDAARSVAIRDRRLLSEALADGEEPK